MTRDMGLLVMELITLSEERRAEEEEAQEERPSYKKMLWPCRIDELEQRIGAALRTAAR